jgi:hypothetical protein
VGHDGLNARRSQNLRLTGQPVSRARWRPRGPCRRR